eukprot:TRINITY_DN5469_c0_g1_i1.p1 TRINITY_DN5469_c0_g1~~TRINITY_DN5469_c0_g1_i1.p1  ORF type:complete len:317 (+),score=104.62 TRINITY_DN5469_c0_g1_i1:474-1424(+)
MPLDVWHHDNAKAMPRGDARMEVLETRMADPQQQAIRDKVLCDPGTGRCVLRGRVLDVGCGTGALLRWAVAAAGGEITEAVGVDPSPAMVEYAARRAEEALPGAGYKVEVGYAPATDGGWQKRLVYAEGSALDLRGRYGLFDHVVFWTCLSHIPIARHDAVFDEVRRCLMPGGTLHVFDNDMAAREIVTTLGDGDPLATVYKHYVNEVVYKDAKYLMRALPGALCNQYGFCAQGAVRPLEVHNVTYNAAAGADGRVNYGYHNLLRALDGYAKWADGRVGEAFIAALKDEAARRAGRGELLMVFAYAYLRVVMPEEG